MKSNTEWRAWGKHDPLYAVASWKGKAKNDATPWTDEEFYELGRKDWLDFKRHWAAYGLRPGHCLEIGCGAGRITKQLVNDFERVTGLDVSEDQIAYAKSRISSNRVTFLLTDGTSLPVEDETVDAIFSCHVFQHFDSLEDAHRVLASVSRAAAPGATLCLHLPIYTLPHSPVAPLAGALFSVSKGIGTVKANLNRAMGRLIMRNLSYERKWLINTLESMGFSDVETRGFHMHSNHSWHEIVLARKTVAGSTKQKA